MRRLYFADPFYVPDEDEPLMNEAHGYLTNDDVKKKQKFYSKKYNKKQEGINK